MRSSGMKKIRYFALGCANVGVPPNNGKLVRLTVKAWFWRGWGQRMELMTHVVACCRGIIDSLEETALLDITPLMGIKYRTTIWRVYTLNCPTMSLSCRAS
jgi:hypothetical protein